MTTNAQQPPNIDRDAILTPAQVAGLFGVDARTVSRWAIKGRLKTAHRTLGGHRRFRAADLIDLLGDPAGGKRDEA